MHLTSYCSRWFEMRIAALKLRVLCCGQKAMHQWPPIMRRLPFLIGISLALSCSIPHSRAHLCIDFSSFSNILALALSCLACAIPISNADTPNLSQGCYCCRRVTNRESAKRIRDKREEQMTLMSAQVSLSFMHALQLKKSKDKLVILLLLGVASLSGCP